MSARSYVHEMGYALEIVKHALRIAEEEGAKKVYSVKVKIGKLLMINPEHLEFCFESAGRGTILEGARLEMEFVEPSLICVKCGKNHSDLNTVCECGGLVSVQNGKELILESIRMNV